MSEVVKYLVDKDTTVSFEVDPIPGYYDAGTGDIAGRVKDAVDPAVKAARIVLDKTKEARPDEVTVKFGIKVSGDVNWLVAKSAAEGNFEVTLAWKRGKGSPGQAAGKESADAGEDEDEDEAPEEVTPEEPGSHAG
jgi:hypothetical protein